MILKIFRWGVATAAVAAAVIVAIVLPEGINPVALRAGALSFAAIALIATGVFPEHLTALGFFAAATLFAVAPPGVIFAGFESSALWLVFGGLFVAAGVQKTGLGGRIARSLVSVTGRSYARVLLGLVVASFVLMIVMPSVMSRVVVLVPLAVSLADELGYRTDSKGRAGLVLAVVFGSFATAGAVLPSNVVNMVMTGIAQDLFQVRFTFGEWLLYQMPVGGIAKAGFVWLVCWWMFREPPAGEPAAQASPPWTAAERRMAVILLAALALWTTDFLHGVDPGWIGLGAGVVTLVPWLGVLRGDAFDREISYGPIFYTAGLMGIGKVLSWSGAGDLLGAELIALADFQPGADALNAGMIFVGTTVLGIATGQLGIVTVLTPLAAKVAAATALPLATVLTIMVPAFCNIWFPYQTVPTLVGIRMGGVSILTGTKVAVALALMTVFIVGPLSYLWWRMLGLFG